MTGEVDLSGHRVLVVEDEYYLAAEAARALGGAGAEVMGPCPTEESARAALEEQRVDAVVLDINLGSGPTFKLAEMLNGRGIPFVFFTGYNQEVIPKGFAHVERLEKPVEPLQIVRAISKVLVLP
jgi:CheY-like chemotaxis protein